MNLAIISCADAYFSNPSPVWPGVGAVTQSIHFNSKHSTVNTIIV